MDRVKSAAEGDAYSFSKFSRKSTQKYTIQMINNVQTRHKMLRYEVAHSPIGHVILIEKLALFLVFVPTQPFNEQQEDEDDEKW